MSVLDSRRFAWLAGLALFAVLAAITPRVCGVGDAGEFVLALALGGVPHPSGYPLYLLAGHGWVSALHALGIGWTHAANLWSAAGAAVAFALALRLAARLAGAGGGPWAAIALVLALAALLLQPTWIASACFAEIYSWHVAWVAALALATLGALEALEREPQSFATARRAAVFGALAGMGLAHHLTSALVSLPLAIALGGALARHRLLSGRVMRVGLLAALVPLAAYGWIAWRAFHPAAHQWAALEPSLAGVWAHASGQIYAGAYLRVPALDALARLGAASAWLLALALAALAVNAFTEPLAARRRFARALFAAALLQVTFALAYGVPDAEIYFLPVVLCGLVVGPAVVARIRPAGAAAMTAGALAALLVIAAPDWVRAAGDGFRNAEAVEAKIRRVWNAVPFESGIVLWTDDHYPRLRALQILENSHPQRIVDNPRMLTWPPARRAFQRATGIDPLAGLALTSDAELGLIVENIRRRTALPVLVFEEFAAGR